MKFLCRLFGHKNTGGVQNVYSSTGKWKDGAGNRICYRAYICERCEKRTAATPDDAAEKWKKEAEVASVMNASRAAYGLKPISWET